MNPSKLQIAEKLLEINSDEHFNAMASDWYRYQLDQLPIFRKYVQQIDHRISSIPFMPIELFKYHEIGPKSEAQMSFKSSGTSGNRSTHHVRDVDLYRTLSATHFESIFGPLTDWVILALLPSYRENGDSSLIFMVDDFMRKTDSEDSKFIDDFVQLQQCLSSLKRKQVKTLLIGVSYALLDFAESFQMDWKDLHIMETGGMKGRKKELTRSELHTAIGMAFPNSAIHSEYGMTELLSQAYAKSGTAFCAPNWVRVSATSISDPLQTLSPGRRGLLAFTDLANAHSCSFIQTRDVGIVYENGTFTVEGRLDHSDIRGCNLLYT